MLRETGDSVSVIVSVSISPFAKSTSYEVQTCFLAFSSGPAGVSHHWSLLLDLGATVDFFCMVVAFKIFFKNQNVSNSQKPRVHPSGVPLQSCLRQQHFVAHVWMQGRLQTTLLALKRQPITFEYVVIMLLSMYNLRDVLAWHCFITDYIFVGRQWFPSLAAVLQAVLMLTGA